GALPAAGRSSGRGVTLALIDTGVALHHPDLQGRHIERRNVVDSDQAAYETDLHGTQLAGVMVATVNNALGIAGIAPEAKVLAIKACWHPSDANRRASCNSFTLAQGLAAAVKGGAQLINLSLGGPSDPLLARLATAAQDRGISIIGAAPEPGAPRGFPVDVPGVIEVAMDEQAGAAPQSLRAPGLDILTLSKAGHYDYASGSSLAAAQVSAVAALLLQHEPDMRPARLATLLRTSRGPTGLVNACAALAAQGRNAACPLSP
ncbi:MAG TPA: S8 family serine peptidase, partial [Burkholderiaceae bacterium]|nr:S8 family serine peptidase [Burkholderiaceae bacterium]